MNLESTSPSLAVALVTLAIVLLGVTLAMFVASARSRASAFTAVLCVLGTVVVALAHHEPPPLDPAVPAMTRGDLGLGKDNEYLGSSSCRGCHPNEHASWSRSHHSKMTRLASDESVEAPFPAALELDGRSYDLFEGGGTRGGTVGAFYVTGPDLHRTADVLAARLDPSAEAQWLADVPTVTRPIVLVTGSHHYQAFWVAPENPPSTGGISRELRQLPFVYHLGERRYLPRRDAFLQPPDARPHLARWNANCIQCHSVAGRPRQREATADRPAGFESEVVEFGIACEACHGPGGNHAAHYRNPLARYADHFAEDSTPTSIINPARLDASRGSQVCGQCHSYFVPRDADDWWDSGFATSYQPGDSLDASRLVLDYERDRSGPPVLSRSLDSVFWPDGTIRIGGREYNGLIRSPCFEHAEGDRRMACTSCHSMHAGAPDNQLAPKFTGNTRDGRARDGMCTQCHESFDQPGHTHHDIQSPGARCVSCHMPSTTYALLGALASHRITSPRPVPKRQVVAPGAAEVPSPRPSACALCHLDESRGWINESLAQHWGLSAAVAAGVSKPEESVLAMDQAPSVSAEVEILRETPGVAGLLAGNAAERAVFADAFGRLDVPVDPALRLALLGRLQDDPYAAVRFIAARSTATLQRAVSTGYHVPSRRKRLPRVQALERLETERDDQPITISE